MQFVNARTNCMGDLNQEDNFIFKESQNIDVEVAYASPEKQELISLSVKQGTTALAAVLASGLTTKYPDINIKEAKMGIFSKLLDGKHLPLPNEYKLEQKDRVEIYRPLLIDPKQARANRVKKDRKEKRKEKEKEREKERALAKKKPTEQ